MNHRMDKVVDVAAMTINGFKAELQSIIGKLKGAMLTTKTITKATKTGSDKYQNFFFFKSVLTILSN